MKQVTTHNNKPVSSWQEKHLGY